MLWEKNSTSRKGETSSADVIPASTPPKRPLRPLEYNDIEEILRTESDYNCSSVDEVDKKCSNYSYSRRTRRWPMVLFYRLVDLSGVKTYVIIYNKCINKVVMERGHFLPSLARELVLPEMKLRVYNERIRRDLRLTIELVIGPTNLPPPSPKNYENPDPGTQKTCAICPSRLKRRTKYFCIQCKKPTCITCCSQICSDCKVRH